MNRTAYQTYMQSAAWWGRREQRLAVAGQRCEFVPAHSGHKPGRGYYGERCEATHGLEVHHCDYSRLGRERDEDLEVSCRFHHLVRHISTMVCPTCGDGPMLGGDDSDDEAIELVRLAAEEKGGIGNVTLDDLSWYVSCSYCER